jgi:hypothetical protein
MDDLKKKEKEMYLQTIEMKKKYWNTKDYFKARAMQLEEKKLYHKQQFYKNLIKEMEEMK